METECVSVRVDIQDVSSLEGWRDDEVAQRLVLVVALGVDVRIRKLVDLRDKVSLVFVFDGVLSENALYVAVHREPTAYQMEREVKLIKKQLHDDNFWSSEAGDGKPAGKSMLQAAKEAVNAAKGNVLRPDLLAMNQASLDNIMVWEKFCALRPVKEDNVLAGQDTSLPPSNLTLARHHWGSALEAGDTTRLGVMRVQLHVLLRGETHERQFSLSEHLSQDELQSTFEDLRSHYGSQVCFAI